MEFFKNSTYLYQRGFDQGQDKAREDMAAGRKLDYHSNHPNSFYRIGWYDGYCDVAGLEKEAA